MREGILGYNKTTKRIGLLVTDLWEIDGFHCGEDLEVYVDGSWVSTRMEYDWGKKEWYLTGTGLSGDGLEHIKARIK